MAFLDSLAKQGIIQKNEIDTILAEVENTGEDLDVVLSKRGMNAEEIRELRSKYFNIPSRDILGGQVPSEVLKYVPEESAMYYKFVPLGVEEGILAVGIVDPDNIGARDAVQFIAAKMGTPYKFYVISSSDFAIIAEQYKGISGEVNKALSELETELVSEDDLFVSEMADVSPTKADVLSKSKIIEEAPVSKIVAVILRHAIEGDASDVHIEPMSNKVRVRFRVDGTLHESLVLPVTIHNAVVARIKILTTSMKLDEKRKPQDGRFSTRFNGRKVDIRVSTFPTYYGEKVVMRILDPGHGLRTLESLGLSPAHVAMVREAIRRPYGIILLTGPTGSGKTTTLYAMLDEIDRDKSNVLSLEDPIEYNMSGVSQSQVHPEIGYTFATGLRSILRQDPDIIMVGEIRDKETAQLAIQAALTGHLVFSTLHTNNAAGVVPRLVDMGVDPFLIAPTLILSIGQRLIKTLCLDGKKAVPITDAIRAMIDNEISDLPDIFRAPFNVAREVYQPIPSPTCQSGIKGRVGAFEIMKIDKDMEQVILKNPVEEEVYRVAREKGMFTIKEDAILKSFAGIVPFDQVSELG